VINIHRAWNNTEPVEGYWFPLDPDYKCTWHWYIHTILKDISFLLILFALWLYARSGMKRDKSVVWALGTVLIVQLIDLLHYVLWARHSEVILALQGGIMLYSAIKVWINERGHGKRS
jgi:ABC-type iron transport system FetAB permease component